ncbi:hypothetical protein ADEAN_000087400 [Angomonas deanei]|uniref:RanBP2-type domain-containing protein n=1 Tax=Angomonas deanei TaxID=59799 RepID=A0A7G2C3Y8_9TRYP|nr:hypothetical protein ADEAN_000087400 [Angomonas deanei]
MKRGRTETRYPAGNAEETNDPARVPSNKKNQPPVADWVCGVCSNINSSQRDSCYRCTTSYKDSLRAAPSNEVCVRHVPSGLSAATVVACVERAVSSSGENLDVVRFTKLEDKVYIRYRSTEDAGRVLVLCQCVVEVEGKRYGMRFSSGLSTEQEEPHHVVPSIASGLPRELEHSSWTAPTTFRSEQEEKAYLKLLSSHWENLSQAQREYYEERVRRALSAAPAPAAPSAPAVSEAPKPATPAGGASATLSRLKERLAQKKAQTAVAQSVKAEAPPPPPPPLHKKRGRRKQWRRSDRVPWYMVCCCLPTWRRLISTASWC